MSNCTSEIVHVVMVLTIFRASVICPFSVLNYVNGLYMAFVLYNLKATGRVFWR